MDFLHVNLPETTVIKCLGSEQVLRFLCARTMLTPNISVVLSLSVYFVLLYRLEVKGFTLVQMS